MKRARTTVLKGILVTLVLTGLASTGMAQFGNQSAIREVVRSIQTRTDSLQRAVQNASDRNAYRVDDLNRLISDFEVAVNQLDRRLSTGRTNASSSDARVVLDRATGIDNFFVNNRIGAGTRREWQSLRADVEQLAGYYNLSTNWGTGSSGNFPGGSNNDYNLSDSQMRQLVQQLNTRSMTFSRTFRNDLNRASVRNSSNDILSHLSEYETALVQLRNRVNSRQSSSSDVRGVLEHASYLNNFIENRQLSYSTENNWNLLRNDLNRLASAYNVAWNWSNVPSTDNPDSSGTRRDLTGTFTLNSSRGDDARQAVDAATRNLSLAERQRVYDSLLRRLDPPNMLALDRRGTAVTIASTRAPQINFTADGREQMETTRNGRQIRVRAAFSGDALTITRTGERANDFSVTFDPIENGRQLLVTRTLYSDRVNQPVTVRTYYDRTSDTAQLNLYDTNREDTNVGGSGDVAGNFIIPDGTQVVAVLNNDLSTQNVRQGDRFTMTVRSPGEYEGATIEGVVSSVERSGRVSGRSQMTLDFDNIRMRDGRTYGFAGILESVRTPDGDVVRVDNEGAVRDSNQTTQTVQRTAIGTAVGAIIGAIAGGGKGAAIGAVIGAGAGAGSVYVQGRNDLNMQAGTEVTVRATGRRG
ncbi:MAG TPA: YMGG-like glycine zipper-containing protein [Pyrinomonadaceae bacterium]|nr:YMGG-like glycine zipper-containing protein [Pyrinomonadaceae bacterium]